MEQDNETPEEEFEEDSLKTCILFGIGGAVVTALVVGAVLFSLNHLARILSGGLTRMIKHKKKRNRTCELCRKRKKNVRTVVDPYRRECFAEELEIDACLDCLEERAENI